MMARYQVSLPITGMFTVEVDASSKEDAVAAALSVEYDDRYHEVEWSTVECVVEGNVFHGVLNRPNVELLDAGDE